MITSRIKLFIIIIVLILFGAILGTLYVVNKNQTSKSAPVTKPVQKEPVFEEETLNSLTAPAEENTENQPAPVSEKVLESLTAPAPKSGNNVEPAPITDDILRSLTAPAK